MIPGMRSADLMCTLNLDSDIHAIIIFTPHILIALPAELLYAVQLLASETGSAAVLVNVEVDLSA